jgi:hypothetical protein
MTSLNTTSEYRRTRITIENIINDMTPENRFHITVASSNHGTTTRGKFGSNKKQNNYFAQQSTHNYPSFQKGFQMHQPRQYGQLTQYRQGLRNGYKINQSAPQQAITYRNIRQKPVSSGTSYNYQSRNQQPLFHGGAKPNPQHLDMPRESSTKPNLAVIAQPSHEPNVNVRTNSVMTAQLPKPTLNKPVANKSVSTIRKKSSSGSHAQTQNKKLIKNRK